MKSIRFLSACVITVAILCSADAAVDQARIDVVVRGEIKEAKASWWGFNATDSTDALQKAINSKVPKLIIDKQASPWIVRPLFGVSDQTIVFEEGAELLAKKGEFKNRLDCLLTYEKAENVTVTGLGQGGVMRMRKADYQNKDLYSPSEWRHCVLVRGGKNIRVENMRLCSSGGDGIEIYRVDNFVIRNVICDDNHRQGLSIIKGRNILVEDSKFINTRGTSPQSGVDIEPFEPKDSELRNIVFRNCLFANNARYGLLIAASSTYFDSKICGEMDIRFENCKMKDNETGEIYVFTNGIFQTPVVVEGKIEFIDCIAENTRRYDYWRPAVEFHFDAHHKMNVLLKNLTVIRGSNEEAAMRVNFLAPQSVGGKPLSRVVLDHVRFADTADASMLRIFDYSFSGAPDCVSGTATDKNGKSITLDPKFLKGVTTPEAPEILRDYSDRVVKVATPAKGEMENYPIFYFLNKAVFWIRANAGQQVEIDLEYEKTDNSKDAEVTLIDVAGKSTGLGTIKPGEKKHIRFTAGAEGIYRIAAAAQDLKIALLASNAPAGIIPNELGQNVRCSTGTLYFHVPEGTPDFSARFWASGKSKWYCGVKAVIRAPDGRAVFADTECMEGASYTAPTFLANKGGLWSITFNRPENKRYLFWDYNFRLLGVSPYVGLRPDRTPELGSK